MDKPTQTDLDNTSLEELEAAGEIYDRMQAELESIQAEVQRITCLRCNVELSNTPDKQSREETEYEQEQERLHIEHLDRQHSSQ